MTRHRKCCFVDTILAAMSMSMKRTNFELYDFFDSKKQAIPSKSAFVQQRKKFNDQLFLHILNKFNKVTPFIWNLNREISKLNYRIHTDANTNQLLVMANMEIYNAVKLVDTPGEERSFYTLDIDKHLQIGLY